MRRRGQNEGYRRDEEGVLKSPKAKDDRVRGIVDRAVENSIKL